MVRSQRAALEGRQLNRLEQASAQGYTNGWVACTADIVCSGESANPVCFNLQKTYEAGPGSHEINRGMGDNRHASRNPPKYRCAVDDCAAALPRDSYT